MFVVATMWQLWLWLCDVCGCDNRVLVGCDNRFSIMLAVRRVCVPSTKHVSNDRTGDCKCRTEYNVSVETCRVDPRSPAAMKMPVSSR